MTSNIEPAGSAAVPCPELNGAGAPSCYRVSVISGSLEVSARLQSADDLELLLKVLEANKGLFLKVERSATETVVKATKTANRSETEGFAKAERETKTSSSVDRLANRVLIP